MELDVIYNEDLWRSMELYGIYKFAIVLDPIIKAADVKDVYSLSNVKSEAGLVWQLIIHVELVDGSNEKYISKRFRIVNRLRPSYGESIPGTSTN